MSGRGSPLLRLLADAMAGAPPIGAGAHLLVAVSGGPDSTALLLGLAALAPTAGWRLTAGHVDHGLRGAAAGADRALVEALARALGVPCVVQRLALVAGSGLEARARRGRLRALATLAVRAEASHVVLGHTADDQAETVLLRLLRGAGRGGLAGMRRRRGRFVRPLLDATRADVRRYLAECDTGGAVDRSNADLRHVRNRVRRLVVPLLAAEFNPRLVRALGGLAGRLRDEDDLLRALARARRVALERDGALDVAVALEPPALGRRVIRAWLEAGVRRGVYAGHVDRVLALAAPGRRGSVGLPGGWRVVRTGGHLARERDPVPARSAFRRPIMPGGSVEDEMGRWRVTLSAPEAASAGRRLPADAWEAVFDADALVAGAVLRSRRPGDRVQLPGIGTRKLQDVLVDAKVPRLTRDHLPLFELAGVIAWVPGVARAAVARVGPATRQVVRGRFEAATRTG